MLNNYKTLHTFIKALTQLLNLRNRYEKNMYQYLIKQNCIKSDHFYCS